MVMIQFGDGDECSFFVQAEDGIRDLVRSRGLGDVYKRQRVHRAGRLVPVRLELRDGWRATQLGWRKSIADGNLSLIHI